MLLGLSVAPNYTSTWDSDEEAENVRSRALLAHFAEAYQCYLGLVLLETPPPLSEAEFRQPREASCVWLNRLLGVSDVLHVHLHLKTLAFPANEHNSPVAPDSVPFASWQASSACLATSAIVAMGDNFMREHMMRATPFMGLTSGAFSEALDMLGRMFYTERE